MSGYYPDGCTQHDFDLAMMALADDPDLELELDLELEEPPEPDAEDPGPEAYPGEKEAYDAGIRRGGRPTPFPPRGGGLAGDLAGLAGGAAAAAVDLGALAGEL